MRDNIINQLKSADINRDDWWYRIIKSIPDLYARGRLEAEIESRSGTLRSDTEDFRDEIIEVCNWDIWGKK